MVVHDVMNSYDGIKPRFYVYCVLKPVLILMSCSFCSLTCSKLEVPDKSSLISGTCLSLKQGFKSLNLTYH